MQQSALGELVTLLLVILIMLGGFAMIISAMTGTPLVGRMYSAIFRVVVLRPLRWMLRQLEIALTQLLRWGGRQLARFLRWSARQLGQLLVYLGRQFGRGVRYAWVRLTT